MADAPLAHRFAFGEEYASPIKYKMKVTYNWLKEYGDSRLSPTELAEALTGVGLVVAEVRSLRGDHILEIEVTSNRPDCLGVIGIAREVAALTRSALRLPAVDYRPGKTPIDVAVRVEDADLCPRYTARVIRGVKVGPSPSWLKERLEAIGLRPINNVVDITNYVLLECSQPLHAFDLDRLEEKRIEVRRAIRGERLETIDGTKQDLNPEVLIIADGQRPVAIAGVMGGRDTEVGEDTRNILLESAKFKPSTVRRAARRLAMATDSSYRFERGVDIEGVDWASKRACKLIQEIAGGEVSNGVVDLYPNKFQEVTISLRMSRLNAVLGTRIERKTTEDILSRLGLRVRSRDREELEVTVPSFRGDISREIDLIEEVARVYGYDNIPIDTDLSIQVPHREKSELLEEKVRELLVGWGFYETITYSIVEEALASGSGLFSTSEPLTIRNPIRAGEDHLRQTLLGNLLRTKKYNQDHGVPRVKVFELSRVYLPSDAHKLPEERTCLGLLWEKEGASAEEGFYTLKGIIEGILFALGIKERPRWERCPLGLFTSERSSRAVLDGEVLGVLGEVGAEVAKRYDLHYTPCMAEIDFDLVVKKADLTAIFKRPPLFPPIVRDMAIVVDEQLSWEEIRRCVEDSGVEFLEAVEFLDLYLGKQIPPGKKGVAFRLHFRAHDRTLRSEEADQLQQLILDRLTKVLGATLRQ